MLQSGAQDERMHVEVRILTVNSCCQNVWNLSLSFRKSRKPSRIRWKEKPRHASDITELFKERHFTFLIKYLPCQCVSCVPNSKSQYLSHITYLPYDLAPKVLVEPEAVRTVGLSGLDTSQPSHAPSSWCRRQLGFALSVTAAVFCSFTNHCSVWLIGQKLLVWLEPVWKFHRIISALLFSITFGDVSHQDLGACSAHMDQMFLYTILV